MHKKTKIALGGIGVSAVVAGAALTGGTSAFLYDLEQQKGNQVEACAIDLTYSIGAAQIGTGSAGTAPAISNTGGVNITNIEPGDKFRVDAVLTNAGDCDGDLWADVDEHQNLENVITEPEGDSGDTTAEGDLGQYLQVQLLNGNTPVGPSMSLKQAAEALPQRIDDSFSGSQTWSLQISAPQSAARGPENRIMTDSYEFVLDFALAQPGQMGTNPGDLSAGVTP